MKIIQTFSSQKYQTISTIDLALWHFSCLCFLSQGYTLKLYCEEKDIEWLKQNKLLQYYSEIDTTFSLPEYLNDALEGIDETTFWFIRKLLAINIEFSVNPEPFVYSDTDLFIFKKLDLDDCDCFFWTLETRCNEMSEKDFYCDWKYFSTPEGYEMPDYVKNTDNSNYNAGLVYFKDVNTFTDYLKEVLKFITNNPCKFTNDYLIETFKKTNQNLSKIWSINAEQRILTGFVKGHNLKVKVFDEGGIDHNGICPDGAHYFMLRNVWNQVKTWDHIALESIDIIFALQKLLEFKNFFFRTLEENNLVHQINLFKKKKLFRELDKLQKQTYITIKELNN